LRVPFGVANTIIRLGGSSVSWPRARWASSRGNAAVVANAPRSKLRRDRLNGDAELLEWRFMGIPLRLQLDEIEMLRIAWCSRPAQASCRGCQKTRIVRERASKRRRLRFRGPARTCTIVS